jgi:putative glutamine amidotransferase
MGREEIVGRLFDATPTDYAAAVIAAGGLPFLIPTVPPDLAPAVLDGLDGLILSGGGDVDPARYDQAPHPATYGVDAERDAAEFALVQEATRRAFPLLGICRGAQVINVALGGSLHQHLDDLDGIAHRQRTRRYEGVHDVTLTGGSVLARLGGVLRLRTNSIHHQGIDRLGSRLRVAGRADDAVPEVIESPDGPTVAVQWHPECQQDLAANRLLFEWLVHLARPSRP